jgi:hypothetical protein
MTSWKNLTILRGEVAHLFGLLLLLFILRGYPVPSGNEYQYLIALFKHWHSDYLLNDWAFSRTWVTHYWFNVVFGWLSLFVSIEALGWLGRISCWILIVFGLFRIGKLFSLPLWAISLSIALWILNGQSIMAMSWMLGTFEAKCVSHMLLLFSLEGFARDKLKMPAILLGLCFSFHSAVGLWGGISIFVALIAQRKPLKRVLQAMLITLAFGLPGLVPLVGALKGAPAMPESLALLSLVRVPHHVDPFAFGTRNILLGFLLLVFNTLSHRKGRENENIRFLIFFELCLGAVFCAGLIARVLEYHALLSLYPFRLFSLLIPLLFYLHIANYFINGESHQRLSSVTVLGILCLLSISSPIPQFVDQVKTTYKEWTSEPDPVALSFKWIAKNTPIGSTIISPPWRPEGYYMSERAQVANWDAMPYDRLDGWVQRMEAIVGPLMPMKGMRYREKERWMEERYGELTESKVESIVRKFGGDYLICRGNFDYQVVFSAGDWKVYKTVR